MDTGSLLHKNLVDFKARERLVTYESWMDSGSRTSYNEHYSKWFKFEQVDFSPTSKTIKRRCSGSSGNCRLTGYLGQRHCPDGHLKGAKQCGKCRVTM